MASPSSTEQNRTPNRPLLDEVASTGDGLRGLDTIFAGTIPKPAGELPFHLPRHRHRQILRNSQVKSTFQQRRLAVIARDWSVAPGGDGPQDEEAAEHLSDQLARIGWDRITEKMLYGLYYGYSVAEALWRIGDGGRVEIDAIKVRDRLRFRFDREGRLRLITPSQPDGEIMPPAKFWSFNSGADNDDDPYGLGLWYELFWPVWFADEGLAAWLQGLDKTARPTAKGKFPRGASSEDIAKLLDVLNAIASDTGIAIPEDMEVELLQAQRSSTNDYDTLLFRMDSAISKIVLSQTMTTDSAQTGLGSTQGEVHEGVKAEVIKADADLLNESFNCAIARWLTDWNFPNAATPIVSRRIDDPEDIDTTAQRDTRLFQIGWQPTEERVREIYGEGYERLALSPAAPNSGIAGGDDDAAEMAEGDEVPRGIIRRSLIAETLENEWEEVMDPLVAPLRDLADRASNFEEVAQGLNDVLEQMDESAVRELLARSTFGMRLAATTGALADDDIDDVSDLAESEDDIKDPKPHSNREESLLKRIFNGSKKKT